MAAEKRVTFRSPWLPWALLAPQVVIIALFFFWPAGQALVQSLQQSDAFGTSVEWVGLENFRNLWNDETYLASFATTAVFSILVASLGLSLSLLLAVFADRVVKGSGIFAGGWGASRAKTYGVAEEDLGKYYAQRTVLKEEVLPEHVASAVVALTNGSLRGLLHRGMAMLRAAD